MKRFKYCIIWEEAGSETVVYGPYDTWADAEQGLADIKKDIEIGEDEEPNDFGHNFEIANYIEVTDDGR